MPARPHASRRRTRRGVTAAAIVLGLTALTACSGGGNGSGPDVQRLTEDEATAALLTETNVGEQYRVTESDEEDDDDSSFGCMDAVGDMEENDAPVEVERDFEFVNEFGLPTIGSQVASYDAVGDATDAFDRVRSALDDCNEVDETDADGARVQLDLTIDDESSTTEADDQLNLVATGTISSEGMEFPFGLSYSAARVDNHVTAVAIAELGNEVGASMDDYLTAAVDRLNAVADGEEPEDAPIDIGAGAAEGSGASDDEGAAPGGEGSFLPLDGGTYTWSNGVTMTLSVERVEPWGDTDDFCGDGSCGVANPEDTRFVFKYEVSVPDDFPEPFDPSSCPGSLSVTSGNDQEALSGVAGDYAQYMDGKIFPGQTKFGVEEYYVEKAYAKKEFYIESTCGDTDFGGESAYFVGPIEKTA